MFIGLFSFTEFTFKIAAFKIVIFFIETNTNDFIFFIFYTYVRWRLLDAEYLEEFFFIELQILINSEHRWVQIPYES